MNADAVRRVAVTGGWGTRRDGHLLLFVTDSKSCAKDEGCYGGGRPVRVVVMPLAEYRRLRRCERDLNNRMKP